jgi:hypothetical protein
VFLHQFKVRLLEHLGSTFQSRSLAIAYKGRILEKSEMIGSLDLTPTDFFVVTVSAQSLASRVAVAPSANVQALIAWGRSRPDCEAALRAAFGDCDCDFAADYLESPCIASLHDNLVLQMRLRGFIVEHPEGLEDAIRFYEAADLMARHTVRERLALWGLDPGDYGVAGVASGTAGPSGLLARHFGTFMVTIVPPEGQADGQGPAEAARHMAGVIQRLLLRRGFRVFVVDHPDGLEDLVKFLEANNPGARQTIRHQLAVWGLTRDTTMSRRSSIRARGRWGGSWTIWSSSRWHRGS